MPILHKNINSSADIHNPKWFEGADNGNLAWKNEKGELENTDELVLPAALDFVDASVAPPTTNTGDIYVLSSGGSVEAGWGAVALKDWVRYDGTDWNEITPQKSTLCYNETDDALYSYNGISWDVIGGDSIYTASGTAFTDVEIEIDGSLSFTDGVSNLWDWRNNGDLYLGQETEINIGADDLIVKGTDGETTWRFSGRYFQLKDLTNTTVSYSLSLGSNTLNLSMYGPNAADSSLRNKSALSGAYGNQPIIIADIAPSTPEVWINTGGSSGWGNTSNRRVKVSSTDVKIHNVTGLIYHPTDDEPTKIGTENVSLQEGHTLIQGADTLSTSTALSIYDNDTTPSLLFDVRNNGDIGLFGGTAAGQQSTTGTVAGFTAGVGTGVNADSTFTGGTGVTAYTISDVVLALKNLNILQA